MPAWPQLSRVTTRLATRLPLGLRAPGARRAVRRLRAGFAEHHAALQSFDECSSGEFAAIADGLGAFDVHLAEVAAQAAALDTVLQDSDEDRARFSAFELFKKSVDLAHSSIGIALSQEEEMQTLEGSLLQNRTQFEQNSLMFRVLVLNVRAEAARIDPENQAVFAAVAGEMAAMEQQMYATVEKAFAELEDIVREAAAGRQHLQVLQASLHHGAQQSIKLLRSELEGIKARLAPCATTSVEITSLLAQARAQTSRLIVSLQYQDIVRQQLDHVGQGFADIAEHIGTGPPGLLDLGYLHHAALVQQTQLGTSRAAITNAGREITEASQALLATGAQLIERFTGMEQVASEVFRSADLGLMFERETANLVKVAGQSEATNDRIGHLLDRIETSVRVFSTEIRRHEFEVLLVALNAQIAASRVPHARALDKLAEETARLSVESTRLTGEMNTQLGDTLTRLQAMRTEAVNVRQTIGREKQELAHGSVDVKQKLARLDERIKRSTGETAVKFTATYEEIRRRLSGLRFPALIAASFAPAEQSAELVVTATAPFATADLSHEGAGRLAEHRDRYTMQGEREAHAAAVSASPVTATEPGPAELAVASIDASGSQNPDDGVELF